MHGKEEGLETHLRVKEKESTLSSFGESPRVQKRKIQAEEGSFTILKVGDNCLKEVKNS